MRTGRFQGVVSLGFNCELAFALQRAGVFEPSLFSWADVRGTDALINGIRRTEQLLATDVLPYSGNMFFCKQSRIGFHGRTKFSEMTGPDGKVDEAQVNDSLVETRDRIRHLASKQREIIETGGALLVVKWFSDIFEEKYSAIDSAKTVAAVIEEVYCTTDFELLYVVEGDNSAACLDEGRIHIRGVPKFSPRSNAGSLDAEAWKQVFSEFVAIS